MKGPKSVTVTVMTDSGKAYTFRDIVAVAIIEEGVGRQIIVRPDREDEFESKIESDGKNPVEKGKEEEEH